MRMSGKILIVVLIGLLAPSDIFGQPIHIDDNTTLCYEKECPSGTRACKKVIETSSDKKNLNTNIYCLDNQDRVLNSYTETVPNPFGPSTTYQSSSFSGTYSSHGQPVDINLTNEVGPKIEDFTR